MHLYETQKLAEFDIEQIITFIVQDSFTHAMHWSQKLHKIFEMLAEFPLIGRIHQSDKPSIRIFPMDRYLIIYEIAQPLKILRVLSAYRNHEK